MFNRNNSKLSLRIALLAVFGSMAFFACNEHADEDGPTLKITAPTATQNIITGDITVKVKTTHFTYDAITAAKISSAAHGDTLVGHIHLYLDVPISGEETTTIYANDSAMLESVEPGTHKLIAVLAKGAHINTTAIDSVTFVVKDYPAE